MNYPSYNPMFRELPTFSAPRWDENAVTALAQQRAAPGIRALRQQVQRAAGRRYDNPQVGRMSLREALQGYGTGLSQIMGAASSAAASEYGQRFGRTSENARAEYSSRVAKDTSYNEAMRDIANKRYALQLEDYRLEREGDFDEQKMRLADELRAKDEARKYKYGKQEFEDAYEMWLRKRYQEANT